MSIKLVDDSKLSAIGTSIRTTGGTQALLTLDEMPAAIEALGGGGGGGFDWSQIKGGIKFTNHSTQTSLDLSGMDTSTFTTMYEMFKDCNSLESIDLSNFDTSSVTNMSYMFSACRALSSLDLSDFDTSSVTDMTSMFYNCGVQNLDLYSFDTHSVTNFTYMLYSGSFKSANLSSFDTTAARYMSGMFSEYNYKSPDIIWSQKSTVQPICNTPSSMGISSSYKFYVPDDLVNAYKEATNWSTIASQIYSINDLPSAVATLYAGHY